MVQLWTNCFWPTCVTMVGTRDSISPRCWSHFSRSPSGRPAKCTGMCSLGHALHCLALHRVVSETCVLFAVNAFWVTLSGRVSTVSTVLVSQRGSECRSCVVAPNAIDFACIAESCFMSQCRVLKMMELCKALEELHVEHEDLPLEQYRAREELPLVQQWARGRATLSDDLETMDLLTIATPPPTLNAAEPRRLRNDFEDFFGTRRPQLICSAEIALHLLTSWDLLVVDKPAGARSRSDKSTEQVLAETTRPCPRCFVPIRRARGVRAHDVRQSLLAARILLALPP